MTPDDILATNHARALAVGNGAGTAFVSSQSTAANSFIVNGASLASAVSGAGLTGGIIGKSFQVAGMDVPSFGVLLRADVARSLPSKA